MTLTELPTDTQTVLKQIVHSLDEKKAADIRVLNVAEVSSITDYLVLATGTSNPHLKALRGTVESTLKESKVPVIGADTTHESGWLVVDGFDFMVHLFTPIMRENYRLDTLWRDAEPVDITDWLGDQAS